MAIEIHPATEDDLPQAAALWHEGWRDAHASIVPEALTRLRTRESFLERLARDIGTTRIASGDGRVLGFSILRQAEVYQFYVSAEARGTGLAAQLMADAEAQLRRSGTRRAWLACTVGNDRAARFYEKMGWRLERTENMSFETSDGPFPLDVWRYEKAL